MGIQVDDIKIGNKKAVAGTVELPFLKGDKGETPYIKDGFWYIGEKNTNVRAEGKDGSNGLTPYIKNDYWYIDNKNTWVKAIGQAGADGKDYIITDADYENIINDIEIQIQPTLDTINHNANTAISIAKGANQSLSYQNYNEMISAINNLSNDAYNVGQNILIITLNVPDLWIFEIKNEKAQYNYISDESIINELKTNGYIQVGFYKIATLETQKADLTKYATKDELEQQVGNIMSVLNLINGEVI